VYCSVACTSVVLSAEKLLLMPAMDIGNLLGEAVKPCQSAMLGEEMLSYWHSAASIGNQRRNFSGNHSFHQISKF
jgi:hypothetical protein